MVIPLKHARSRDAPSNGWKDVQTKRGESQSTG